MSYNIIRRKLIFYGPAKKLAKLKYCNHIKKTTTFLLYLLIFINLLRLRTLHLYASTLKLNGFPSILL